MVEEVADKVELKNQLCHERHAPYVVPPVAFAVTVFLC